MGQIAFALSVAAVLGCTATVAAAQMAGHGSHQNQSPQASAAFDPATADVAFSVLPVSGDSLRAGEEARITVTVTDRITGAPIPDLSLAGWMLLRRNAQVSAEIPCAAKATLFTQGRVTSRPDVDLNAARLLVLNRDGSILVVDPQVDFTITQIESVIPLPGVPADWALSTDGDTIFVALPLYNAVAVIDAASYQVSGLIELPKGSLPTRILPLSNGSVAIYASAGGTITIAHPDGSGQTDPVAVGAAPVALAATADRLYVASAAGRLTAIDTDTGALATDASISTGPPALALSTDGTTLIVASAGTAEVAILEPRTLAPLATIEAATGMTALALTPNGQYVILLNGDADTLLLAQISTRRIVASQKVAAAPVEITLSHDYAYIRGLEGDHFTLVELADLDRGVITPLDVQSAGRPVQRREALAQARLVAPYGHGALVGNVDEGVAYYYMEGMNTPMGTVNLYGPAVQGLMTIDRGFHETAPGTYSTTAKLPFAGVYDVPIAVQDPGNVTCFTATAGAAAQVSPQVPEVSIDLAMQQITDDLVAGQDSQLVVQWSPTTADAVAPEDVRLLVFSSGGDWQARSRARTVGEHSFAGHWIFPHPGRYGLSVEIPALGIGYADLLPFYFNVSAAQATDASLKEKSP